MTDIPALVASEAWRPIVDKGAKAVPGCECEYCDRRRFRCRETITAALTALIESGMMREDQSGWLNYKNNQFFKTPALILNCGKGEG